MRSHRKFTSDFKRKVVQELGSRPVEEICREYELQKQLVYRLEASIGKKIKKNNLGGNKFILFKKL